MQPVRRSLDLFDVLQTTMLSPRVILLKAAALLAGRLATLRVSAARNGEGRMISVFYTYRPDTRSTQRWQQ